jgi:hypothetical protein
MTARTIARLISFAIALLIPTSLALQSERTAQVSANELRTLFDLSHLRKV